MNIFWIILSSLLLTDTGVAAKKNLAVNSSLAKWVIESRSSLNIQGRSNISSFQCDIIEYLNQDTLEFVNNIQRSSLTFYNSALTIDINRFDCHQRFITGDFRKTLKADENRYMQIRFLSINNFDASSNHQHIQGIVEIDLAGAKRKVAIDYTKEILGDQQIHLTGSQVFRFSDFNLTPPRKLAGLIKIEQEIKVNFQLYFKTIE